MDTQIAIIRNNEKLIREFTAQRDGEYQCAIDVGVDGRAAEHAKSCAYILSEVIDTIRRETDALWRQYEKIGGTHDKTNQAEKKI